MIDIFARTSRKCRSPVISIRPRHSRRALDTQRSSAAFARSARTGVLMIRMPIAVNTASKAVNLASRSRSRNLKSATRSSRFISRLRAC